MGRCCSPKTKVFKHNQRDNFHQLHSSGHRWREHLFFSHYSSTGTEEVRAPGQQRANGHTSSVLKASKLAEKPAEETEGFFTGRTGNIYSHSSARTEINGNLSYCGRAEQEHNTMPWEGQVKTLSWRLLRPLSINQMWFRVNTSKLQHKLSWKDWTTNLFNLIPIQTDLPALPWSV